MRVEIDRLSAGYGRRRVIEDVSLTIRDGDCVCILGPNGSGKTTLFKAVLGLIGILDGEVRVDGERVADWPRAKWARAFGYVPQSSGSACPFSVIDAVVMGRTATMAMWAAPTKADYAAAEAMLERLGISSLAERSVSGLSGGERQLVMMARALAQGAKVLVLDEPTSNLDLANQVRVVRQIRALSAEGVSVIMTSHLPGQASLCATTVAAMRAGRLRALGSVDEAMDERVLREIYGVTVHVMRGVSDRGELLCACVPSVA